MLDVNVPALPGDMLVESLRKQHAHACIVLYSGSDATTLHGLGQELGGRRLDSERHSDGRSGPPHPPPVPQRVQYVALNAQNPLDNDSTLRYCRAMLKTMALHPFRFLTVSALGALGLVVWAAPPLRPAGAASPIKHKPAAPIHMNYPVAKTVEQVDDYHGTKVSDPYRWLESLDSPETRKWVEDENKVTFDYLGKIPARDPLRTRLTELWNFERYTPPHKDGGRYFLFKNNGLQNQSVLYTAPSLTAEPTVLLDPNTLAADGTVALAGTEVSHDGTLLAYGLAVAGSDWNEWHVRDVATAKDRPDVLKWIKFSGAAWTRDNKGFYYSRYDEPKAGGSQQKQLEDVNFFNKLFYHRLGTQQAQDSLVYERKDHKDWQFQSSVTDDGRYLIIAVSKGTDDKERILYQDLQPPAAGKPANPIIELVDNFEAEYSFVDNDGPVFFFKTNLQAPRGKLIAIDIRSPKERREVIPQAVENLRGVQLINNVFVASYLKDAYTQVRVFDLTGKPTRELTMPGIGTATGFAGKREDKETFYSFTSYNTPPVIYRLDLTTLQSTMWKQPTLKFAPADYETKQVFYPSKDGTKVPMFITHRKGLVYNGKNPAYLYGYGGFNIPITPGFNVTDLVFMEMGGIIAYANLRGGGEYGEDWHKAGTRLKKQTVFDDFISAAEWLIKNKYTSTPKLAIAGGSNGGLLIGACLAQRPDLFGAALPAVGVMDMLRFHKFTIGWEWIDDYGSSENPEEFKALHAYSPLHNLKAGIKYPATMVTTGDHDDRVVPGHSFKFAATLQAAQKGDAPVLIRIETRAGHGAGKPTTKRIEEAADRLAFLVQNLNIPWPPAAAK